MPRTEFDEPSNNSENSWSEYRRLVTETLRNLDQDIKELTKKVDSMRYQMGIDIAQLKVQAGVWGAIAGVIASIIAAFIIDSIFRK